MQVEDLKVEIENRVMRLTLNRPSSLNAFSADMMNGLLDAFSRARTDPDIRAILLTGEGRAFSAGGDVKGMGRGGPVQTYDHIGRLNQVVLAMAELDVPIVAAVNGWAAGAGVNLALACDVIYAADNSKFVLSFSKVGLLSDGGGLFFLPRTIGLYRAKEVLFNAEPITASDAMQWGMVNHVVPADNLMETAMTYASQLAGGPSRAFAMIKKIANRSLVSDLAGVLEMERSAQCVTQATADHVEGVRAFIEKRNPVFSGE